MIYMTYRPNIDMRLLPLKLRLPHLASSSFSDEWKAMSDESKP